MSEIKERPILFNAEMVRAILDGRKTQTRRHLTKFKPTDVLPMNIPNLWVALAWNGVGAAICKTSEE